MRKINLLGDGGEGESSDSGDIVTHPCTPGNTNLNASITEQCNDANQQILLFKLRMQCLTNRANRVTTSLEAEDDLRRLNSLNPEFDKFLITNQSSEYFDGQLQFSGQFSAVRVKLLSLITPSVKK